MKTPEGWGQNKRGHVGDPPTCHPDRPFFARGQCERCYQRDYARASRAERPRQRAFVSHVLTGLSRTPAYRSWLSMRHRCDDPYTHGYRYYGGRGIAYDPRWSSFEAFLADMGPRPEGMTLDRINNDGSYEPTNCRWVTRSEQERNKRPYQRGAH